MGVALSRGILVVDDNVRVLNAVSALLRRRGFVSIAYSSLASSLQAISEMAVAPEAAILDLWFPQGRLGTEVACALRARFDTKVPIAIMTGYSIGVTCEDAAGWVGMVTHLYEKPISGTVLDPFLAVAAGSSALSGPGAHATRNAVARICMQYQLAPQEARIVGQLAAGSTRSTLPEDLGISVNTVKGQIRTLLTKTGLSSTDELVGLILRLIGE
jgi:FixJ family two-component response regulator